MVCFGSNFIDSLNFMADSIWDSIKGGNDRLLRLWGYDDGQCHYVGKGHSGHIQKCKFSPDQSFVVTVGTEGAIFMWVTNKFPS